MSELTVDEKCNAGEPCASHTLTYDEPSRMQTRDATFLLLTIGLSLGSCISERSTASPSAVHRPVAVVVRFGDAVLTEQSSPNRRVLEKQAELFEASHPQIRIVLMPWVWTPQQFAGDLAAGKVPDVMTVPPTEGHLLIDTGYVADLTDMMNEWPVSRDMNEAVLAPFVRQDRVYAVPAGIYIMGLFYDKHLFRKAGLVDSDGEPVPPATWSKFADAARVIKAKTGSAGFCIFTQYNQGGWTFLNWGWQAGGDFERREGNGWRAVFDERPIVDAMQFVKDLRWKYGVLQDELFLDVEHGLPMIAAHQCGMAMVAPDWFNDITTQYGGDLDDLGLTVLPAGPAGNANVMGGAYYVINANAPHEVQQAAFEWITWRSFSVESLEIEFGVLAGSTPWTTSTRNLMYKPNSQTARNERRLLDNCSLANFRYRTFRAVRHGGAIS